MLTTTNKIVSLLINLGKVELLFTSMHIAIIGTGYVGLVSGVCLAELGHTVTCIDNNEAKILKLNNNISPIFEPNLEPLIKANLQIQRLSFTTDLKQGIQQAKAIFIAVETPTNPHTKTTTINNLHNIVMNLAKIIDHSTTIVIKSTVPIGTNRILEQKIKQLNPIKKSAHKINIDIASNPEFLREGTAVSDFMQPDRIIIGINNHSAKKTMQEIYQPLLDQNIPVQYTDFESAETIKYAANSYLATKIAFINEIANLCEITGANINAVAHGIGLDHRISADHLKPGPGYGGSCFPKDTVALSKSADEHGCTLSILNSVIKANEQRKLDMINLIVNNLNNNISAKTITILGVTFKANTDDVRDSPAISIIHALQNLGANLKIYDPAGMHNAAKEITNVTWAQNVYQAMYNTTCIVITTEWDEFKNLDLIKIKGLFHNHPPLIIDLRNLYALDEMHMHGISYVSIGRSCIHNNATKYAQDHAIYEHNYE